jgi:hypothetical protein
MINITNNKLPYTITNNRIIHNEECLKINHL